MNSPLQWDVWMGPILKPNFLSHLFQAGEVWQQTAEALATHLEYSNSSRMARPQISQVGYWLLPFLGCHLPLLPHPSHHSHTEFTLFQSFLDLLTSFNGMCRSLWASPRASSTYISHVQDAQEPLGCILSQYCWHIYIKCAALHQYCCLLLEIPSMHNAEYHWLSAGSSRHWQKWVRHQNITKTFFRHHKVQFWSFRLGFGPSKKKKKKFPHPWPFRVNTSRVQDCLQLQLDCSAMQAPLPTHCLKASYKLDIMLIRSIMKAGSTCVLL